MNIKYVLCCLLILIAFVGGYKKAEDNSYLESNETKEEIIINEESELLVESELVIEEPKNTEKFEKIVETIDKVSTQYGDNMAIYYYNFDTKEQYAFNEDKYFVSASLKKLPVIMQILDMVQDNKITLDTKIKYESGDFLDGTGTLQFEDVIGERTINELIELSILESDNIAYNMMNRFCNYTFLDYMGKIVEEPMPEAEYTKFTASQTSKLLYKLYTNPDKNPHYQTVLELMKKTAFNDRLDKYIPHDKVAHKIGSYFRYYHDAGIVYGEETYMLVVLSKDIGVLSNDPKFTKDQEERIVVDWGKEACEVIANMSKEIYDIIQQ